MAFIDGSDEVWLLLDSEIMRCFVASFWQLLQLLGEDMDRLYATGRKGVTANFHPYVVQYIFVVFESIKGASKGRKMPGCSGSSLGP